MREYTIRLRPYQAKFVRNFLHNGYKEGALVGGIRSGKTFCGAHLAWRMTHAFPNIPGIIAANTYPQLRDSTLMQAKQAWDMVGAKYKHNESKNRIEMNGAVIYTRSVKEIDPSRGLQAGWCWFDEAAYGRKYDYDVLMGRLELEPNAMFLTMTGKGKNWVHDHFVEDLISHPHLNDSRFIISGINTKDNTNLTKNYISLLENNYSGNFARQEMGGELVTMEGAVFEISEENLIEYKFNRERSYDLQVDFGYRRPAVIFVQETEKGGKPADCFFDAILPENPNGTQIEHLCNMIKERKYGDPYYIYCDPAGDQGSPHSNLTEIEYLRKRFPNSHVMYSYNKMDRKIETGIMILHNRIMKRQILFNKNLRRRKHGEYCSLIGAYMDIQYPETRSKRSPMPSYYEKDDVNDHPVDAGRYWAINKYPIEGRGLQLI